MLSLKISDKNIDMPDDFSFTMNLKSPIFGDVGSYSYPFKIPATPKNSISFGFRHRISSTGSVYADFPGVCLWEGIPLFSGTIKMKVLNQNTFEVCLLEGNGDFNYHRKNDTLQDVDFGQMDFEHILYKIDYITNCQNHVYPERNFAFPQIENKSYFDELPTDPELLYFNYYLNSSIYYFTRESNRSVVVPMLYVRFVLAKIFEHLGMMFDDSFFAQDTDYNSLVLYNSVDCNCEWAGYFNYDELNIYLNYHLPRMTLNDFFSGLESFFNIRFFYNKNTGIMRLISVDKIVKAPECIEFSKQVISVNTDIEEQITGYSLTMAMDTDDDRWAVIKAEEEERLKFLKSSVQTASELPPWPASDNGDIRYVNDEHKFRIMYNRIWTQVYDMGYIELWSNFIYRNNNQSIETKFSTLIDNGNSDLNSIVGNARSSWKEVTGKLFFAHYQDWGGYNKRMVGHNYTDTKSLFYSGENGLFNSHYKAYCDFCMSTKTVKIVKSMTYMELKDFDFSKKIIIYGIKYLVKTIQVTFKKDRILPALLECYTCQ